MPTVQATHRKDSQVDSRTLVEVIAIFVSESIALSGKVGVTASFACSVIAWIATSWLLFRKFPLRQYPRLSLLAWGATTVAFYFFTQFLRPDILPQFHGILTPQSQLLFPTHQKGKFPTLEIGDSCTMFTFIGPTGEPFLKMLTDSFLTIELIEGQVKVSTTIRDASGKVVATLIRNEWQVAPSPGSWDLNYTADALEVKDARGMIVLQVRVLSDRIQLQGEWWNDAGQGWRLVKSSDPRIGTGGLIIPLDRVPDSHLRLNPIKPIFNYPSSTHLGEINISHIFPRKCNVSTQSK